MCLLPQGPSVTPPQQPVTLVRVSMEPSAPPVDRRRSSAPVCLVSMATCVRTAWTPASPSPAITGPHVCSAGNWSVLRASSVPAKMDLLVGKAFIVIYLLIYRIKKTMCPLCQVGMMFEKVKISLISCNTLPAPLPVQVSDVRVRCRRVTGSRAGTQRCVWRPPVGPGTYVSAPQGSLVRQVLVLLSYITLILNRLFYHKRSHIMGNSIFIQMNEKF